jgi:predicted Zn-dependent peptidase
MIGKTDKSKKILASYKVKPTVVPRPEKATEVLSKVERAEIYDNIQLPAVFMGYRFPEETHEDMYALEMMNAVLSGGASSRMNKSLVEKNRVAVAAFSFAYGLEDAGAGLFGAIGANGVGLDQIENTIDAELDLIKSELISQEEFEKVRNQFENDFVSSNSSVAGIAENLANSYVYFGSANYVNTELKNYMAVTREDIQRVAKKYLTQDARIILHYLPKKEN